jgi:hypothetical protein
MHLHRVSPFGIVRPSDTGGFTNRYQSEGARGRQIIIVKGSSVVGSLISLSSFLVVGFFFEWSIGLLIWWRGRSHFTAFRIPELVFKLVNLPLELELLKLRGELLHTGIPWSSINGGGLSTGTITLGQRRYLLHTFSDLWCSLSKRLSSWRRVWLWYQLKVF